MMNWLKNKKVIWGIVIALFIALVGVTWMVGEYFIHFMLKRGTEADPKAPPKAAAGVLEQNLLPPEKPKYVNDTWSIKMGNEKRIATAFLTSQKSDKWIIMVHGYCRDQRYVWNYADEYLSHGFNVLTPDLNASGDSEGEYLTMGVKEGKDVAAWANLLVQKHPNSRIVLHGVSMGAATVMLATQEKLPKNVYAVIEDCGYTSANDMFALQLERMFGLPGFPILDMVNIVSRFKLGGYMTEAAPLKAVTTGKLPILFIHGDSDTLVPQTMQDALHAASTSKIKEKFIIPGAGHADSMKVDKNTYFKNVYAFIKKADL